MFENLYSKAVFLRRESLFLLTVWFWANSTLLCLIHPTFKWTYAIIWILNDSQKPMPIVCFHGKVVKTVISKVHLYILYSLRILLMYLMKNDPINVLLPSPTNFMMLPLMSLSISCSSSLLKNNPLSPISIAHMLKGIRNPLDFH